MKIRNLIKRCVFLSIIVIIVMIVISIIVKYEVEGEKSLPYSISQILLVSTVDGEKIEDGINLWNVKISQVNDVFIYIDKQEETQKTIKEIKIENFIINKKSQKGETKIYRPTGELNNLYASSQQDYLNENITYTGGLIDDLKSLEISNVGGVIGFRIASEDLGSYISNESMEIKYDGTLLSKIGVSVEEIIQEISFDIVITTNEDISFKGTVNLTTPVDTVIEDTQGPAKLEITDFTNVVFKRI